MAGAGGDEFVVKVGANFKNFLMVGTGFFDGFVFGGYPLSGLG